MAERRPQGAYIWVTTLAKLLTGENSCEWAGWFKAHHRDWTKPESDFDSTTWMLAHTALVNEERESLERMGYAVQTENQNLFRLRGKTAIVAGKPDLVAEKHDIIAVDAKTGKPSPSHRAQVIIYQYALPKALKEYEGRDVRGHVRYPASHLGSPASAVSQEFIHGLGSLVRRLADPETEARRIPSAPECRFCDIGKEDCPARIDVDSVAEGATDDF